MTTPRHFLFSLLLALCFLSYGCSQKSLAPEPQPRPESSEFQVPDKAILGRITIKVSEGTTPEQIQGGLQHLSLRSVTRAIPYSERFAARHHEAGLDRWYVVSFDKVTPLTKAGSSALDLDFVEKISFDTQIEAAQAGYPFNDPFLNMQWHYYNDGSHSFSEAGSDMGIFGAWEIETGKPEVIVAVSDAGIDYLHEDLAANMWINEAEANGAPGVDDDANGYVDDIYGYNFCVHEGSTNMIGELQPDDHGTHVAGTIAAVNNNGTGVCGIAGGNGSPSSGVRLMSLQIIGQTGSYAGRAFVYAADAGAQIMNCSWGYEQVNESSTMNAYDLECIQYFNNWAGIDPQTNQQVGPMKGGLIFFAAGNEECEYALPAMIPEVMAVASIGADYRRAYYSCYGDWVDFSATGGDAQKGSYIFSTVPESQYAQMQGTSMAAPHATGVAALVLSHFGGPGFTREKLIHILKSSSDPIIYQHNGSPYYGKLGVGLIKADSALRYSEEAPAQVTDLEPIIESNSITLTWTIAGESGGKAPYQYFIYSSESPLTSLNPAILPINVRRTVIESSGQNIGETLSYTFSDLKFETTYYYRIVASNSIGGLSELSAQLVCTTPSNAAPTITPRSETSLNLKSHESASIIFDIADADGHPMTYTITGSTKGITHRREGDVIYVDIDALKLDEGTNHSATLSVKDIAETTSLEISFSIAPNHAPTVRGSIADLVFNSIGETRQLQLSNYFQDADDEVLIYECALRPSGTIVKGSQSGTDYALKAASYGSAELSINAVDARNAGATLKLRVLVRDGSKPIDLYPNPVVSTLNLRTPEDCVADISIRNKLGAAVYEAKSVAIAPFSPAVIDLSAQSAGVYYVSIVGEGISETYSIVKK